MTGKNDLHRIDPSACVACDVSLKNHQTTYAISQAAEHTELLTRQQLPEELRGLESLQMVTLDPKNWEADIVQSTTELQEQIGQGE